MVKRIKKSSFVGEKNIKLTILLVDKLILTIKER